MRYAGGVGGKDEILSSNEGRDKLLLVILSAVESLEARRDICCAEEIPVIFVKCELSVAPSMKGGACISAEK